MLAQLEQGNAQFKAAGLQVVGVAMGQPKHANQFCGKLAPSLNCLTHESTAPYAAWGLNQAEAGEFATVNVALNGLKAALQGHTGAIVYGDVRMMPGTFIVNRAGIITWTYYSKDVSDHPSNAAIIAAAQTAAVS